MSTEAVAEEKNIHNDMIPSYLYRVTHLLANLGWVYFDFGCSTLCLVLPWLMGNWLSSGTSQIKVNPTMVRQEIGLI